MVKKVYLYDMCGNYFSYAEAVNLENFFSSGKELPFIFVNNGRRELLTKVEVHDSARKISIGNSPEKGFIITLISESGHRLVPFQFARLNNFRNDLSFWASHEAVA